MYGCNTRNPNYKGIQDTYLVQDGYEDYVLGDIIERDGQLIYEDKVVLTRKPRYIYVRNKMSRDCKYDRWNIDPKCAGCERERKE